MNKVVLVGRLTKDVELKFTPGNGTAVATGVLAVNRRRKQEGQPDADFIPIVIWGKQAENTANYTRKGSLVSVSGRIQTRNYDAKDGSKRYVTEVVADEVVFLSRINETGSQNNQSNDSKSNEYENPDSYGDMTPIDDGEIPF